MGQLDRFLGFLETAPTPWHAVQEAVKRLQGSGFVLLDERQGWKLEPGGKYCCVRGGSLGILVLPTGKPMGVGCLGAHTDSPGLRLKPTAEWKTHGMVWWGVELYGAPIVASWLNRDLYVAGRVVVDRQGRIEGRLVAARDVRCILPQLALHLDKKVNEELKLDLQEHLPVLAALSDENALEKLLGPFDRLLGSDLFLVPAEAPARLGAEGELVAGYRLDNLASAWPTVEAFAQAQPLQDRLLMGLLWDHEEIGSHTAQGAASPMAQQLLTRAVAPWKLTAEEEICLKLRSLCLSIDVAHGFHPAHAKKFDPHHQPLLGQGVVLKTQAGQRYLSDATTQAALVQLAQQHQIPVQWYAPRNTVGAGSTIGPIHGAATGMPTIDLGPAVLSMHSIREIGAWKDLEYLSSLLHAFLAEENCFT